MLLQNNNLNNNTIFTLHLSLILIILVVLPCQTISFSPHPHNNVNSKHLFMKQQHTSFSSRNDSNNESTSATTTKELNEYDNNNVQSLSLSIEEATKILRTYDKELNEYIQLDGNQGLGGGISATKYWKEEINNEYVKEIREALIVLSNIALRERAMNSAEGYGRVMLGITASSIEDAIGALKGYVPSLNIPRGLLHG